MREIERAKDARNVLCQKSERAKLVKEDTLQKYGIDTIYQIDR